MPTRGFCSGVMWSKTTSPRFALIFRSLLKEGEQGALF
jgi:hypothetical protein